MADKENDANSDGVIEHKEASERCRVDLLQESNTWRYPHSTSTSASSVHSPACSDGIKADLTTLSGWKQSPAIANYWWNRRGLQERGLGHDKTTGAGRTGGAVAAAAAKSHPESSVHSHGRVGQITCDNSRTSRHAAHSHESAATTTSEVKYPCPLHSATLHKEPKKPSHDSRDASKAKHAATGVASVFHKYTTVTSPRTEKEGISLQPDELIKVTAPAKSHHGNARFTAGSQGQQAGHSVDEVVVQYTPYHLLKQMFTNTATCTPPPSGVDLRHQCQQLSAYLYATDQLGQQQYHVQCQQQLLQMQQHQQRPAEPVHVTRQLGGGGTSRHVGNGHVPLQTSSMPMCGVTGSSTVPGAVQHHTQQQQNSAQQRSGRRELGSVQRRPSLTSVLVEPCLPAFSSAFDNLTAENRGSTHANSLQQQQRRRVSIPNSNQTHKSNWTSMQKASHAELLLESGISVPNLTQAAGLPLLVSHASSRGPELLVVDPRDMSGEGRRWRPADSHAYSNKERQTQQLPSHQRAKPPMQQQQTCSLVEMSLAESVPQRDTRHTNSMINFPLIQAKGKGHNSSLKQSRTGHGRTRGDKSEQPQSTTLPKIDGFKFMGDIPGKAPDGGIMASKSVHASRDALAAREAAGQPSQFQVAKSKAGRTTSGRSTSHHRQAVKPGSKPGHMVVEWKAM
eukprot:scpid33179/ scgid21704/ 